MAKKKRPQIAASQEDSTRAQQVLEHYHQLANNLHTSGDQKQAEALLTDINNLPEAAQITLLKALAKEHHTDAADVLLAINELSSLKNVRKEARRSLIQLEEARIYPHWSPPLDRTPVVQIPGIPLRFWKGIVTDSMAVGEVQLNLFFEAEDDSAQARVLGFLLEFSHEGVKDFFTRTQSKRALDRLIGEMEGMYGVETKPCTLAQGRSLLLKALAVNQKYGTVPHRDYRLNLSLVNQLVLEAPDLDLDEDVDFDLDLDEEDEDEEGLNLHDLTPQQVVVNFVEAWGDGDYDLAYDLLSSDSPIREGLTKDEWIERREDWADEADPGDLEPNFIHEREAQKSKFWLPNPFSAIRPATRKEFEVGWSIELKDIPLSEPLPELPQATAIYEETGRHWFWTSYSLVQEEDAWRIQSITDEGANALSLPLAELQKRSAECDERLEEFLRRHQPTDPNVQQYVTELLMDVMQSVYYRDALLKHLPLDRSIYELAVARLLSFDLIERSVVYLEPLAHRFPENRAVNLRGLAIAYGELGERYFDVGDDERGERFQVLAEEAWHESLDIEDSFAAHIGLAELLIDENERLDEAEEHLHHAQSLASDSSDEAHVELHLGQIAMEREEYEQALEHYQRVAEAEPTSAQSWSDIAEAHRKLGNVAEAEANYRHAIELEPDDEDLYYSLSKMYSGNNDLEKAVEVIEEGLIANPDSAVLNVYLGSIYLENGDYEQAEIFLDKAEELDPDLEVLYMFRQLLNVSKAMSARNKQKQLPALNKPDRGKKKKRR